MEPERKNFAKMTTKELLTANRDSVISSIKYVFKIWKTEDVKQKMIEFLSYAEDNINATEVSAAKNTKTLLKYEVQKMAISHKREEERKKNLSLYGTEKPKLADIMARAHEGESFNHLTKQWTNNSREIGVN